MNKEEDTSFLLGRVLTYPNINWTRLFFIRLLVDGVLNRSGERFKKKRSRCRDSLVSCGPKTDSCKKVCGFKNIRIRVQSRIYRLGEKSRVAECHELLGGCRKFFEMNMRRDAIWCIQCILRHDCVDREYLLHVHWPRRVWMIFPIQLLVYCNDNNTFFWGGGMLLPLKYPR